MQSKLADFAPHIEGNNADFAQRMEGSHADLAPHIEQSSRDQKITEISIYAKFLDIFFTTYI